LLPGSQDPGSKNNTLIPRHLLQRGVFFERFSGSDLGTAQEGTDFYPAFDASKPYDAYK
jgi:hypothetical protein